MNSKTKIARIAYEHSRANVSVDLADLDVLRSLVIDDVKREGSFRGTIDGWLWVDAHDGQYGVPNLGFGPSTIDVRRAPVSNPKATTNVVGGVFVPDPDSTFGPGPLDPDLILENLYLAGFTDETNLLGALSIAAGESGFYPQARNWLPSSGFRPASDVLGVSGPAAAWNKAHTQQGHQDRGLWQFNSKAHPEFVDAQCDDPRAAAAAVVALSKDGKDWTAWGFREGFAHYTPFYDGTVNGIGPLRPIVAAFLNGK
jgi:hypothetical protein